MSDKPLHDRLSYLFQRYLDKTYTPDEHDELMQYISQPENDQQVRKLIDEGWQFPLPAYEQDTTKANSIFNTIIEKGAITQRPPRTGRPLVKYMAAAVLLLAIGLGIYYYTQPAPTGHRPGHILLYPTGNNSCCTTNTRTAGPGWAPLHQAARWQHRIIKYRFTTQLSRLIW
jgi:hypothetical protein